VFHNRTLSGFPKRSNERDYKDRYNKSRRYKVREGKTDLIGVVNPTPREKERTPVPLFYRD